MTSMFPTFCRISTAVAVLFGAIAAAGCGRSDTGPGPVSPAVLGARADDPAAREFYPLSVGNEWSYHRDHSLVVEVIVGPPYKRVETFEGVVDRRVEGTEVVEGVVYFVEAATLTPAGRPPGRTAFTLYCQDHSGLYVSDAPGSETLIGYRETGGTDPRPADSHGAEARGASLDGANLGGAIDRADRPVVRRALREHAQKLDGIRASLGGGIGPMGSGGRPGGVLPAEFVTLAYPLHMGAEWYNRREPFVVRSVVESLENLDLPAGRFPAWRIRVENELLDPEDRVVVWYGRAGRLALSIHAETLALDTETGETALITTDDEDVLTDLTLAPR